MLNQVSVSVLADSECGSSPVTDICAGQLTPVIHDSCQVRNAHFWLDFKLYFLFKIYVEFEG